MTNPRPSPPAEQQLRAALDFTVGQLRPEEVNRLRTLLEDDFDAGAFWLGMQTGAFVMSGVNVLDAAQAYPQVLRETMAKMRAKAPRR